jgi:hypothetical protein
MPGARNLLSILNIHVRYTLSSPLLYTLGITSIKKLKDEVGLAGPKSTQIRVVGIIMFTIIHIPTLAFLDIDAHTGKHILLLHQ